MSDALDTLDAGPELSEIAVEAPVGRAIVDRIRQRHAARTRHLDRPIPQWEGDVVARYGPVSKKVLIGLQKRKASATVSNADLLVHSCIEILVRDETGALRPAREADGLPAPIRFDGRLADLFEITAATATEIAIKMYADDIALGKDAQRILEWQTGEGLDEADLEEVEDDLGEASAAT